MRISRKTPIIFILVATGALIFGCTPDTEILGPEPGAYRFSATPDILMENFEKAYTAMDLEEYGKLLHEDFIFSFQACDVEKLGLSKDHFTREDELITASHMFGRKPYVKSNGSVIDPILEIDFLRFELAEDWVPMDDPDRPGLLKGIFHVDIFLDRGEAGSLSIRGTCVFFVVGSERVGFRLIGWVDRTGGC
ncbi:MAG: hypothetical protein KAH56_03790 [Candidatus Krumholzibacteria bacterium]|nr:hypothetical protein [Candidatus Krumholzibacteria bacterium]